MAETRVLKQLTNSDRTTSDGKLFHNVTVAGKKLKWYSQGLPTSFPVNLVSAKGQTNASPKGKDVASTAFNI